MAIDTRMAPAAIMLRPAAFDCGAFGCDALRPSGAATARIATAVSGHGGSGISGGGGGDTSHMRTPVWGTQCGSLSDSLQR
tara:strand:- start:208 stop:450 length:243 start_codon:yes stop_codon:yes gene_type:complete